MDLDNAIQLYGKKLLRYAASILGNHADAEDAIQDVFIAAYNGQASFDGQNLGAWLYKITFNICMNYRRRRKLFFFADISEEPVALPHDELQMPEIMQALSPLKPQERAVLYMRTIEGYSYAQLAQIMGKREGAVRMMYMRAKQKAAVLLQKFSEQEGVK
ncbi:MAG: RNA polymerase sigma factor [Defluviitaleaceae bacterium]|nr:RNA polymerase sigma factor [Defluviitaleaceae bacterium]